MTTLKSGIPLTDFREKQRLLFVTNTLESIGVQTLISNEEFVYICNNQILEKCEVDSLFNAELMKVSSNLRNNTILSDVLSEIVKCVDSDSCTEFSTGLNIHPFTSKGNL